VSTSVNEVVPGETSASSDGALLTVAALTKHFPVTRGVIFRHKVGAVQAVDGLNF
jgi:hypothetical protein